MKIYWDNLADDAVLAQVLGTADASFPVENIQDYRAAVVWRGQNSTANTLRIDTGSARAAVTGGWELVLYGLAGTFVATLVGSNNADLSAPGYTDTIFAAVPASGYATLEIADADTVYRYYGILLTTVTVQPQISRIHLGPVLDTTDVGDPDFGNLMREFSERANRSYSVGGVKYAEQRANYTTLRMRVPYITETIQAQIREWVRAVGTWRPFFLTLSDTTPLDAVFYGTFQSSPSETVVDFGTGFLWSVPYTMEEQL